MRQAQISYAAALYPGSSIHVQKVENGYIVTTVVETEDIEDSQKMTDWIQDMYSAAIKGQEEAVDPVMASIKDAMEEAEGPSVPQIPPVPAQKKNKTIQHVYVNWVDVVRALGEFFGEG